MTALQQLRQKIRQARKALSATEQTNHANDAAQHLNDFIQNTYQNHQAWLKVGCFLSQDGELETQAAIEQLWQRQETQVYLPVLETKPDLHMGFAHYAKDTALKANQFKILEPDLPIEQHIAGNHLDLVLVPLVAFDSKGQRLGMGGGYYDRSFEFKRQRPNQAPLLIGWAHSLQMVEHLETQPWDVPLDGIITEKGLMLF